jgi:methionyl-tRNA formyltransferase
MAVRGLADAAAGRLQARPQPDAGVTYAAKIAKAEATIDWRQPADVIERRLRAFDPFPGARSALAGETITCWRGAVRTLPAGAAAPGEVVAATDGAITVACGQGALALLELQRPGGRRMTAAEFLRGRPPRLVRDSSYRRRQPAPAGPGAFELRDIEPIYRIAPIGRVSIRG